MKHLSLPSFKPRSLATIVATAFAAGTLAISSAQADVYHVVVNGDTLSSISARYNVPAETLRSLNKLETSNNDNLPQMLLRIPDGKEKAPISALPLALVPESRQTASRGNSAMVGRMSSSLTYSVQANDTWETIAAAHQRAGYHVTADSIRLQNTNNGGTADLKPGSTIMIPLQSTTFSAPPSYSTSATKRRATSNLRTVSSTENIDGATVSPELPGSTFMPTATELANGQPPVYRAPGVAAAKAQPRKNTKTAVRGPSTLSSRGYFPSPNLDGVRVLGPQEDAPNVGRPPEPRVRAVTPSATKARPTRVAYVAKIASSGARIRRLPDSDAATLYRCAQGTEIAVIKQSGSWAAILMSDRSTGWVPGHYLKMTGQSVDISSQVITDYSKVTQNPLTGKFSSNNPMVAQALTWLGTRYVYGGESRRGIDCSALVQNSFRACGVRLPRTAAQQAKVGTPVNPANLQAGDRLYFSASGTYIDHTGLYMGNGMFVHASGSGRQVMVSRLSDRRNWNIFVGARR